MYKLINLSLAAILIGLIFVWQQWPDNNLHLIVCDVGQGDGLLVTYKDQQLLVDAGPDDSILTCLSDHLPFWDRTLEAALITHPQADHMTGLVAVVEHYQVKQLLAANLVNDIDQFWALRDVILREKVPVKELLVGDELKIGALQLTVLWPHESGGNQLAWMPTNDQQAVLGAQTVADPNIFSTVLLGEFGSNRFLLTGDIDTKIEEELITSLPHIEVLKVAHHGSKYSSSEHFLAAIKPRVAVISSGKNRFGHPTQEAIDRLQKAGAKVLRTDLEGEIELISNGISWWQN